MSLQADLADLGEGDSLSGVRLTVKQAAALNSTGLVSAIPDVRGWKVKASHTVGVVACDGFTVRVRPKVGPLQVLRLLARAHGIAGLKLDDQLVGVDDATELTTALAVMFAQEGLRAFAAGPLRGYRTEDQSLTALRGRVRLRDQELRRFGQVVPIEVTVDEWTMDTEENRLIRTACRRLLRLPSLPRDVRRRLVVIDRALAEAGVLAPGVATPRWARTRLNQRFHRLLGLAELVLRHHTIEHRVGDVEVRGFVLSMAWLFEKLVTQIMLEQRDDVRTHAQMTRKLDTRGFLTIKPDLAFACGSDVVGVADTKYKILDDKGRFPNADAYQLVTYCARLGLREGHLIYAAGERLPEPFEIIGSDVRLVVHALALSQETAELEEDVRAIRRKVLGESIERASPLASLAYRN